MTIYDELKRIVEEGESAVLFTVIDGEPLGAKLLVWADGKTAGDGPPDLAEDVSELLARGRGRVLEQEGRRVFAEVLAPPPRLLVFGAVDTPKHCARSRSSSAGRRSSLTRAPVLRRRSGSRARTRSSSSGRPSLWRRSSLMRRPR